MKHLKKISVLTSLCAMVLCFSMCRKAEPVSEDIYDERLSGGAASVFDETSGAYGNVIAGLDTRNSAVHILGDRMFNTKFVSSGDVYFGLGTIYNNVGCGSCHHNDSKGEASFGNSNSSMFMRVSIGNDEDYGPISAPGFGHQIQDKAIYGITPEASIGMTFEDVLVTFSDGETVTLKKPIYSFNNLYTSLPTGFVYSPRFAPNVFGMGLLDAIPQETIEALADPNDMDGNGISGKANYVYDPYVNKMKLGRFGRKATVATLNSFVASVLNEDIGITNYLSPEEPSKGQTQFVEPLKTKELPDSLVDAIAFYLKTLAVPARRNVQNDDVVNGKKIFIGIGCAKCHIPVLNTGYNLVKQLSNQRIQPYTDLLLHDMGADLADNRPDYKASGTEWRTPPLWGIGLLKKVNGKTNYLHDGRATTLQEAILWHGGEAEPIKNGFKAMPKESRAKLITFLESL